MNIYGHINLHKSIVTLFHFYSRPVGFFTAPVNGVYYLQFTVCGNQPGFMGVFLIKNNQKIIHNVEWKEYAGLQYFTKSLVLELKAGDEIHLVLPTGDSVFDNGNNQSTFSGFLLSPL